MRLLWITVIVLIAYGSLYPFNFDLSRHLPLDLMSWLANWEQRTIRSDLIANILLFIPFGFFGALNIQQDERSSPLLSALWLILFGVTFALLLQFLQFFLPSRVPHAADALVNSIGILLGISMAAYTNSHRIQRLIPAKLRFKLTPVLLVLSLWVGWAFFPYIPVFEAKQIGLGIESVFLSQWSGQSWLKYLLFWLVFYYSFCRLMFLDYSLRVLLILSAFILVIKLSMLRSQLGWSEVSAIPVALIMQRQLSNHWQLVLISLLLIVLLAIKFITPFEWLPQGAALNAIDWIPFKKFLGGSTWYHLSNLFEFSLLITSLGYALARSLKSYKKSFLLVTGLMLVLSLLQLFLLNKTPDVTDVILTLILMLLLERIDAIRK